tara:strand:- start:6071 stop:6274 length:204 start_codon:yes stop_codon:yes gene_type:complete
MEITVTEMEQLQQQLKIDYEKESYQLVKELYGAVKSLVEGLESEELEEELSLTELVENTKQYLEVYG